MQSWQEKGVSNTRAASYAGRPRRRGSFELDVDNPHDDSGHRLAYRRTLQLAAKQACCSDACKVLYDCCGQKRSRVVATKTVAAIQRDGRVGSAAQPGTASTYCGCQFRTGQQAASWDRCADTIVFAAQAVWSR